MALTTIQTLALARVGIQEIIDTTPDDQDSQWPMLFTEASTKQEFYRTKSITGFGFDSVIPEGSNIDFDNRFQLYQQDLTPENHVIGFQHTVQAEFTDFYGKIMQDAQEARDSIFEGEEKAAANIFVNGFDTTNFPGVDGVSLFHTAHPTNGVGPTYSNRPAVDITLSAVNFGQGRTELRKQKDPRNKARRFRGNVILLVPNDLEYNAKVIIASEKLPGSADNDVNVRRNGASSHVMDYLTDANDWYVVASDKRKHSLTRVNRIPMTQWDQKAIDNLSQKFSVFKEYLYFWNLGYGAWGTQN